MCALINSKKYLYNALSFSYTFKSNDYFKILYNLPINKHHWDSSSGLVFPGKI